MDELLSSIQEKGLFEGFTAFLEQGAAYDSLGQGPQSPLDALAGYLSKAIARALLFGGSFLTILLVWFLVSHALDLAFHLPILSQVNTAGGAGKGRAAGCGAGMAGPAGRRDPHPPGNPRALSVHRGQAVGAAQ